MKIELLLDADEFWSRMKRDLAAACHRAWVQTFTFEGDRAGTGLARALDRSTAMDRRLFIDGYSLLYHSDRIIPGRAWIDRSFRREVMLTHRWIGRLRRGGVGVRFGNPPGVSLVRLLRRNHKKVAIFDDSVVYLGGINFSDHNFAWHDMMFRIESADVTQLLAGDYLDGWAGRPEAFDRTVGPLRIIGANGRGNRRMFAPVVRAIAEARDTIDVVSAYLSHPFTHYLADAAARGVRVRILTPSRNNKSNLARHVIQRAARHRFEILRYRGGMSHMKAMLIDGEMLITGSSNFDFMSYDLLEEHVLMTGDLGVIDAFRTRVWQPDSEAAERLPNRISVGTLLGDGAVRVGAVVAGALALPLGR